MTKPTKPAATCRLNLYGLTADELATLERIAKESGVSMSELVIDIVRQTLGWTGLKRENYWRDP